jgi:DNA polymerase-1
MGLPVIVQQGYEADDLIATVAQQAETQGHEVAILAADKDLLQLVSDNIYVVDPKSNMEIRKHDIEEKYGVSPEKFTFYQAIIGDKADNGMRHYCMSLLY